MSLYWSGDERDGSDGPYEDTYRHDREEFAYHLEALRDREWERRWDNRPLAAEPGMSSVRSAPSRVPSGTGEGVSVPPESAAEEHQEAA